MKHAVLFFLLALCAVTLRAEEASPLMHIESDDERILMKRGEKVILVYNKVPTPEAAENDPVYTRSGYIHPVYSPEGREVTGDYAADHPHQHALFFAWTKTSFEDRSPEFWNQKKRAGRVSYARTLELIGGRARSTLVVEHLWEDLTAPEGPRPVLKETWAINAHDAGEDRFVFDIVSAQWLIGQNPLTIEKYHYGGMAIRGNDQWFAEDGNAEPPSSMLTSEGLGRIEGNHSRPKWVAMEGPIDGGLAGVAVLAHPKNFRFPQWVRLHPTKPYFVFSPMVEESFQITTGKPYVSRYRYVVCDGKIAARELDRLWEAYRETTPTSLRRPSSVRPR